jgi:hypothetical protein
LFHVLIVKERLRLELHGHTLHCVGGKFVRGDRIDVRGKHGVEAVIRVARFFLVQNTKTGKIYQISTNYTKCPLDITKDRKMDQVPMKYTSLPLQDLPKFTQIWIFGLKTNHLATLAVIMDCTKIKIKKTQDA